MLRRASSHVVHLLMEAVLGGIALVALAGCFLVWRLAQGPIDLTELLRREQHRLPGAISIGHAALAWEGLRDPDSPLDIRFADLRIEDAAGATLARFPSGRVSLAVAPLWRGAILPASIVLQGPAVTLQRDADGTLRLDLGQAGGQGAADPARLLGSVTRPGVIPGLDALRLVRLRQATVSLRDASLGVLWRAGASDLVLRRHRDGAISGEAALDLSVGQVKAQVATQVTLDAQGVQFVASLGQPVSPAAIARVVPALGALAAVDAPVAAGLSARFDAGLVLRTATLSMQVGAGFVHAGQGGVALQSASAVLRTDGQGATLRDVRVALAPPPGAHGAAPVLTGQGSLAHAAGGWQADFALAVDRVAFADLASYWPPGTGGGARPWLVENVTGGLAQNAVLRGTMLAAPDGSGAHLSALSGGLEGHDLAVHWLRPVPPIEHAEARLVIEGPDALHIDVTRAAQGRLALSAATVRITGLAGKDQFAGITTRIDGSLPDALALLDHPRLHLLSRQPFSLRDPAGQARVQLTVSLPLDVHTTFDDMAMQASAALSDVHLGGVAVGRDLDGGALDLAVDTNHLTVQGDGRLGGVPARLGLAMDFRDGPPEQVTTRVTATGRASASQLQAAWLPAGIVTAGDAGFDITYAVLRDASATVALRVDGRDAAIATPFGWSKAVGMPAQGAARLILSRDRLTGIEAIEASGPELTLASHVAARAGKVATLVLDALRLGRTEAHGSVGFPNREDARWRVALRGTTLDLSNYLKQRDNSDEAGSDDETRGPPWQADLAFDRVVLARDESLAPVTLKAESDGLHFRHLELAAGRPGSASVRVSLEPATGGRSLAIDATDAGAVMLASGVADNIRGGRLKLAGRFDDSTAHSRLAGSARLDEFRITDAPAIGRLLKLMTFYGAVDLLRGPGLGFAAAVVPFTWQLRVLHMSGARAFSASLGLTAQGDIDMRHHMADVTGTIVPAYFFNQLLGRIPLLGAIFSPETGGGVFAARYSVRGPLKDPKVGVNPLSALTPGFLRGVFGLL